MPARVEGAGVYRRRLVGLYALTVMARDGPLHGYGLSETIAAHTDGAWRPGPGSVYPSLRKLVQNGFARASRRDRRTVYSITTSGRRFLTHIRARREQFRRAQPDLSPLWAEVMGAEDVGQFLLARLRRALASLETPLAKEASAAARGRPLADSVRRELELAIDRLGPAGEGARPASIARRGRTRGR